MNTLFYQTRVSDRQLRCWILLCFVWLSLPLQAEPDTVSIGTADLRDPYHPIGAAICRMLNKQRFRHGIRCIARSTSGSIYNLQAVRKAELNMGLALSDWQHHARYGTSQFAGQSEDTRLRALFSLHTEPFTIIARADSDIRQLTDLIHHRVNLGAIGGGTRGTMGILMDLLGWQRSDFKLATELLPPEQVSALCENKLDAIIVTTGHPGSFVTQVAETCAIRIIPAEHPVVDELIAKYSYYRKASIPGGLYPGNPDDIPTLAVGATLVSSTNTSRQVVYTLVKSVFDNLDEFRSLHPVLAYLQPAEMVQDALSAPLHEGAEQYYREAGIACYDPVPSEHNRYCQPGAFIPANRSDQTIPIADSAASS